MGLGFGGVVVDNESLPPNPRQNRPWRLQRGRSDSLVRQKAHAPGCAAGLEAFIRLLLFLRGNNRLACIATLADAGPCDERRAAPSALFRHRLLKRENARLLWQQMRIVEIAVIQVSHLKWIGCDPARDVTGAQAMIGNWESELGVLAQNRFRVPKNPTA
jgi:hypothetical protein